MEWPTELTTAVAAVREAAWLCRLVAAEARGQRCVKEDGSPVTMADLGAQALICRRLRADFPGDAIIGEENADLLRAPEGQGLRERILAFARQAGRSASPAELLGWIDAGVAGPDDARRAWILDPIDGTRGFLRGGQYAVCLALRDGGAIRVAAMGCPRLPPAPSGEPPELPAVVSGDPEQELSASGTLFVAAEGLGSWAGPLFADGWLPAGPGLPADFSGEVGWRQLRVSRSSHPPNCRFCESYELAGKPGNRTAGVAAALGFAAPSLTLDSQVKYGLTAAGTVEAYLRFSPEPERKECSWDHATGFLLVTEAGGRVTDLDGKPLDFDRGRRLKANRGIVASNGLIHEAILAAIRRSGW